MFLNEVIGYSYFPEKKLYVLHLTYDRVGTTGKCVETVFAKTDCIDGGQITIGSIVRVYRDKRGFTQGIEII